MRRYQYEILLGDNQVTAEDWANFCLRVSRFVPILHDLQINVIVQHHTVYYFLESPVEIPTSINIANFLLRAVELSLPQPTAIRGIMLNRWQDNLADIVGHLEAAGRHFLSLNVRFHRLGRQLHSRACITEEIHGQIHTARLLCVSPGLLLAVDFKSSLTLIRHKIPKYLQLGKTSKLLTSSPEAAVLELEAFPYSAESQYSPISGYDFDRHSLVLGSSGAGKSKFLAYFIHQIYKYYANEYQVVVIDPHDALKDDVNDIADRCEINFQSTAESIDLFVTTAKDPNVTVELTLDLFKSLIGQNYNSQLERVLRYSTYLLSTAHDLSFATLRRLLLDVDYREKLLKQAQRRLPVSVTRFFATDFQELKNQFYDEAIAPLIAFIDEMQMVPAFSESRNLASVLDLLDANFLNLFSLNQLALGGRVVQTIAGLLMQQIFILAQRADVERHLIVIIDEVAVVETPILRRFLSELRKFHVTTILAGQYFAQISPELKSSIFANVANYYLFHTSKADAELLAQNLDLKPANSEERDERAKLITKLKTRECLVQVSYCGEAYPFFRAKTLDQLQLAAIPAKAIPTASLRATLSDAEDEPTDDLDFEFGGVDVLSIMQANTTSRKKLSF